VPDFTNSIVNSISRLFAWRSVATDEGDLSLVMLKAALTLGSPQHLLLEKAGPRRRSSGYACKQIFRPCIPTCVPQWRRRSKSTAWLMLERTDARSRQPKRNGPSAGGRWGRFCSTG
jgi:hypothetical protein